MALEYTPKYKGVSIYDSTENRFVFTVPLVWNGSEWKHVDIKVRNGSSWEEVGGACTQMIPFYAVTDSQPFLTSASQQLIVPEYLGNARLKDSTGSGLKDSDGNKLYGEYRGT